MTEKAQNRYLNFLEIYTLCTSRRFVLVLANEADRREDGGEVLCLTSENEIL